MAEYESPEIATDPTELAQLAWDYLTDKIPGFTPAPGGLDTWMVEANAQIGSEIRDMAVDVPPSIMQYLGATLHDVPPIEAERATAQSTWTMIDNAGYTIPAGTIVAIPGTDPTQLVAFEVAAEVTVSAGATTTAAGEVSLVAIVPGTAGNLATGTPQLIDNLSYVASIAVTDGPEGGTDAEDNLTYLDRLVSTLQLLAPRPILPEDFAVMARSHPLVYRAAAKDGAAEREVDVSLIDTDGEAVDVATANAVKATLEAEREINFVVNIVDPTYTTIDVTFDAVAEPDWTAADVEARAESAVAEYLSPAGWGVPAHGDERGWINNPAARLGELYAVLNRVPGLAYVTTLTLGVGGGAQSAADVPLAGTFALPRSGVIAGTVTA